MKILMRDKNDIEIDVKGIRFSKGEVLVARVSLDGIPMSRRSDYMSHVKDGLSKKFPLVDVLVIDDRIDITKVDLADLNGSIP